MAYIDYDNNIPTHTQRRAASLAEQGQQDRRMPITSRSAALPGRLWRLVHRECTRFTRISKFLVVGGTGVLVNSLALLLLVQWAHLPLVPASALSAELGIVHNFSWNDRWTFGRTQLSWLRFARFNLVSLAGLIITTGTLWVLVRHLGLYYLAANLLGITLATAWNFAVNSWWTWGGAR
jgi:putative flippase GtrA